MFQILMSAIADTEQNLVCKINIIQNGYTISNCSETTGKLVIFLCQGPLVLA